MDKVKLGTVMTLHRSYDLPNAQRKSGDVPVISSSGISGSHSVAKLDGENVITGRYGTIGEVFYHNGPCWPLNTTLFVEDFHGNDPKYVAYLLEVMLDALQIDGTDKSTVPGVDRNVLHDLVVPYISDLASQQTITRVLSAIDAKITNNKKLMAELEDTVRLIYDYWFTQFDFPDDNGRPYRSSGGKMTYNEKLRRSIPIDWNVDLLLAHIKWIGGSQPPKSEFKYVPTEGYIRFIQNRDYASDDNRTFIPVRKSNKVCDRQDIMMDKYGDAGKTRYGLAGAYNVALSKIHVPKREEREYVRYFLSSNEIYSYLHASCIASTRASLNEENFGGILLVVPSVNILHQFDCLASCILEKSLQLMDESQALEGMRNWLLPMLMNGQLVVE